MKKLTFAILITSIISTAQALPTIQVNGNTPGYDAGYAYGYSQGKDSAYKHAARAVFITGALIVVGVVLATSIKASENNPGQFQIARF